MTLPLLLGECPSRAGNRFYHFPLSGAIGQRLCEWAGIEPEAEGSRYGRYYWPLRERFDCLNVMERHVANWSAVEARRRWSEYVVTSYGPNDRLTVVCLGRRASDAVGHSRPWGEWFEAGLLRVVAIPHPSGRNLLYNDEAMVEIAKRVLREAMDGFAVHPA